MTPPPQTQDWDHVDYEEKCFYFNTTTRLRHYPHGISGAGLDDSWDCAAEVAILRAYRAQCSSSTWSTLSEEDKVSVCLRTCSLAVVLELSTEAAAIVHRAWCCAGANDWSHGECHHRGDWRTAVSAMDAACPGAVEGAWSWYCTK